MQIGNGVALARLSSRVVISMNSALSLRALLCAGDPRFSNKQLLANSPTRFSRTLTDSSVQSVLLYPVSCKGVELIQRNHVADLPFSSSRNLMLQFLSAHSVHRNTFILIGLLLLCAINSFRRQNKQFPHIDDMRISK